MMKTEPAKPHEQLGVRRAIQAGMVARTLGLLMNIVAMPVAYSALGMAGFSIFLALVGLTQAISLTGLGISKAVAQRAAQNALSEDELAGNITTAAITSFLVSLATALIGALAIWVWAGASETDPAFRHDIAGAISIFALFVVVVGTLQTYIDLQSGLQRLWVVNVGRASGAFVSILLVFFLVPRFHSVSAALASVSIGYTLGALITLASVPSGLRRLQYPQSVEAFRQNALTLLQEGWPFILVQGVSIAFLNLPTFLVGLVSKDAGVVEFGIHARALLLIWSVTAIIANPVWPALRRLTHNGAQGQARTLLKRSATLSAGLILGAAIAFVIAGDWILKTWIGYVFSDYWPWRVTFPLALIAVLGNQFINNVLMGLGAVLRAGLSNSLYAAFGLVAGFAAMQFAGPSVFYGAVALAGFIPLVINTRYVIRYFW